MYGLFASDGSSSSQVIAVYRSQRKANKKREELRDLAKRLFISDTESFMNRFVVQPIEIDFDNEDEEE